MPTIYGTLLDPSTPDACTVTAGATVRIDDDGRIAEITPGKPPARSDFGGPGCWILPGFVDAHLHLPQWDRRGIEAGRLFEWYERIVFPAEERFADVGFAERLTEDFVTGVVARGTTMVACFGSPFPAATDRSFEVFARRGLRAIHGMTLADENLPAALLHSADTALEQSRELAAKWHGAAGGRLSYAFSPRMTTFCSPDLLGGSATLASMLGCYVQTHVAESLAEVVAARRAHPGRLDDIDVLAEAGLLTRRTLLGHAVVLNQPQRKQVAEAGAAVVHCPTANLFLGSGMMDYAALARSGVSIALGSGTAGGHEPFMPRVAAEFLQTARGVASQSGVRMPARAEVGMAPPSRADAAAQGPATPARAWWLLTRGAAEALGMGERIGGIAPGLEADLLIVRPEKWLADLPPDQQVSALLYTLAPPQIEHVFIAGRKVN